jgi:restriction system protein
MAEITRRRQGELVRGVFAILREHPEGMHSRELLRELERRVPPTSFEASTYPKSPDTRRYEKVVRFSTIAAVKAGWLVKSKGEWSLTQEGVQAYDAIPDPEDFQREAGRLYDVWAKGRPAPEHLDAEEEQAPSAGVTLEESEEHAWDEIRRYVATMPPYEFQNLVASLLGAMGYYVAWVAPPGPDRGIDLIAHTDPLGITEPRIVVQVKRYGENKVSSDSLRSFLAVLGDKDVGIFVCPAGFTSDAEREARTQERRRLTLLDLERFVDLWVKHYDQLSDEDRQRMPLRPVHFLVPQD